MYKSHENGSYAYVMQVKQLAKRNLDMPIEQLITKAKLNSKKLFLIDGFGAIISAFLLGVVLVKFQEKIGVPVSVLYLLATIPVFFAAYDFYCYQKKNLKTGILLKGIALLNLAYCCLSLGLVFYHFDTTTNLGCVYFIIEITIVLFLIIIEFRVGNKIIKSSREQKLK